VVTLKLGLNDLKHLLEDGVMPFPSLSARTSTASLCSSVPYGLLTVHDLVTIGPRWSITASLELVHRANGNANGK
jgi:hypothetical protein